MKKLPAIEAGITPCILCEEEAAEIKSDMGAVCRDCKAALIIAENALAVAQIPPQPPDPKS